MKVQLLLILSVWSCAEWSRVDGQMMAGNPRFLPGLNQNRFNNHQMMPQRPQRPPPPMNRPPQPERESQSSHPTSGPFAGQHSRPPPSESSRKSTCGSGNQTTTKFANYWDWTCGKMLSLRRWRWSLWRPNGGGGFGLEWLQTVILWRL